MSKREFKYTGKTVSLDNHESDYYESTNWIVCVWDGIVFNSNNKMHGELESDDKHFHFVLEDDIVIVYRAILSMYDGLGKQYIEGYRKFPIPKYVCDFIRSLKEKYII